MLLILRTASISARDRGIGNIAAHETAWQITFSNTPLPNMECGPGSETLTNPIESPCDGGINSVYEAASVGDWDFLSTWNPPIHWEKTDLPNLQNYLLSTK